jgi:hypothetical protein
VIIGEQSKSSPSLQIDLDPVTRFRTLRIGNPPPLSRGGWLCTAFEDDYARIVSIARAKVEFIEPMLALAVTKLPEAPCSRD